MARTTSAASKKLDAALNAMIAAAPAGIGVNSEVRTRAQQQKLYDAYIADPAHHAPAAKPGSSNHEKGLAADLAFTTPAARTWAHANAARFGLTFPLPNEPWHVELIGASKTAASTASTAAPVTDKQIADYAAANYGYAAMYLRDKEIGPILRQAAKEGWDPDKLQGALTPTKWWKQHSEANVEWDYLNQAHPADAQQKLAGEVARIGNVAQQAGLKLTPLQIHDLGVLSLRSKWNDAQLNSAMHYHAQLDPNKVGADYGTYTSLAATNPEIKNLLAQATTNNWTQAQFVQAVQGTNWFKSTSDSQRNAQIALASDPASVAASTASTRDTMKQKANAYMVPLSDAALGQWVTRIQHGDVAADAFDSYLKEQAKSLFPGMTHAIDSGVTVDQYVEPYRQYAAQTLEVAPHSIDFLNDPKYSKALFNTDPKTGQRTQMSLSDWQGYLRQLPDFNKTAQAQSQAADMALMLTKTLGGIA